jgi:hypothetical protein
MSSRARRKQARQSQLAAEALGNPKSEVRSPNQNQTDGNAPNGGAPLGESAPRRGGSLKTEIGKSRQVKPLAIGLSLVVGFGILVYAVSTHRRTPEEFAGPAARGSLPAAPGTSSVPVALAAPPVAAPASATTTTAAAPPAVKFSGPRIQFPSLVYNFGTVTGDTLVNCVFTFTNVGNALLELPSVAPGCGCMKMSEWSRKVEPGQTGTIKVQYNSYAYIGHFGKSVYLECNDPMEPKLTLEIQGTVWRPIEIKPLYAVLNLCPEVLSNAVTVRLISHLDEPLILTDLKVNNPAFAVELQTNQPGKEYQVVVTTPTPHPTNDQQGQITLKTSTTNLPVVTIPARVNVLPVLLAIPAQIKLPPLPLATAFTNMFWVRNNGTNGLVLSDPAVNAGGVSFEIQTNAASNPPLQVTTVFPAGFDAPTGTNLELRLKSNDPLVPVLAVPVLQTGRRDTPTTAPPKTGDGR